MSETVTAASTPSRPWKPGDSVFVAGYGVQLRSVSPADIDETFVTQLCNPEVLANLAIGRYPGAITRANLQKYLATFDNRRKFFFGIRAADGAERLGFCSATREQSAAVITLAITRRDLWGKGAATAAVYLLRVFLFGTVGIHKMVGRVYAENAAAIRRLEQRGWVREGVLREAERDGKGGWRDIVLFGLLRAEHAAGPPPPPFSPSARDPNAA